MSDRVFRVCFCMWNCFDSRCLPLPPRGGTFFLETTLHNGFGKGKVPLVSHGGFPLNGPVKRVSRNKVFKSQVYDSMWSRMMLTIELVLVACLDYIGLGIYTV